MLSSEFPSISRKLQISCFLVNNMYPLQSAHSLANRHSCSTRAEKRDRKCFSMQLILVVGKMDMINQICQMLSFCWKLLSAYFADKKWLLSTLISTVVTAKCACIRITNVWFFSNVCMQVKLVNIWTYVQIWVIKTASLSHNCNRHAVQCNGSLFTGLLFTLWHWPR